MLPARRTLIRKIGLWLLVTYLAILMIPFCHFWYQAQKAAPTYQETVQAFIEGLVPENATDVRFTTASAFQSQRWRLRFTIPSSSLAEAVATFCPGLELTEGGYISLYNDEAIVWWRPEDAKVYSTGSCVQDNMEIYPVLIDQTNPQFFLVYLRG